MEGTGLEFMERTRYRNLGPSGQQQGVAQPPTQIAFADGPVIPLSAPETITIAPVDLRDAIERRRSVREYDGRAVSLEELSFLLWCTQGVRDRVAGRATFRTVPSAGARHPFETVIFARRVDGLSPGLYQYLALDHRLVALPAPSDVGDRLAEACLGQEIAKTSAVLFLWIADSGRMTWRYGERGFRYVHLDAGHVCQNLYLAAEAIGAGTCAIGAFDDDAVNGLVGLDRPERFAVYLAAVGKRRRGR
jgi:SagB-type dehydrogenase family enzyme